MTRLPNGLMLMAALLCATCGTSVSSQSVPGAAIFPKDIGTLLQNVVANRHIPGIAFVVLQGDEVVAQGVAGVRRLGKPDKIAIGDQFLLCSGTKAMTGTLAGIAVQEGKLSWNSTLKEVLADTFPHMRPEWNSVTLLDLLEHRAGVPGDKDRLMTMLRVELFSKKSPIEKRRKVIAAILSQPPVYIPGSKFIYASIDYFIVSAMLEKVTGTSWEDQIVTKLWQPLHITSGGVGSPQNGQPAQGHAVNEPWGHWGSGRPVAPSSFLSRLSAPTFYAPAGTVHISILDWSKFIALHLRGDPADPHHEQQILQETTFSVLHLAPAASAYQGGWFLETHEWARGTRPSDTGRVLRSLGDSGFWHVDAIAAPEVDFAIVCMVDQGGAGQKPAALACGDAAKYSISEFVRSEKNVSFNEHLVGPIEGNPLFQSTDVLNRVNRDR